MPHRLPVGKTVVYGNDSISERPALATKLAQINDNWNQLEWGLTNFYAYLMAVDLPRIPGWSAPIHPVALQVFDELEAFRPKLQLFEALLKWRLQ